jgi:hypothetical protein
VTAALVPATLVTRMSTVPMPLGVTMEQAVAAGRPTPVAGLVPTWTVLPGCRFAPGQIDRGAASDATA